MIEEEPSIQLPETSFRLQISPHKVKSAHITVCKKCVASEQSETLQSPPTVCGNCLVPKLNWRMHCNSNCFCLSVSFFFFSIYYVIELWRVCLKGKLSKFKEKYAAFHLIYSLPVSPLKLSTPPLRKVWVQRKTFGTEKINLLASLEWYLYPTENYH